MKFIRNTKIRDRIIDVLAKGVLIAFSALVCLWMISGAKAAAIGIDSIHQQKMPDGSYGVDFVLSKAVNKEDISVDFQRNFIQISFKGVSAYPARTEKLNYSLLEKVFTYQYQPDLARARLLLKSPASTIQNKSSWEVDKQIVRILIRDKESLAHPVTKDAVKNRSAAPEEAVVDADEQKMRDAIIQGEIKGATISTPAKAHDPESLPVFAKDSSVLQNNEGKEKNSKSAKIFGALLLVIGLIGAGALAFRRFVQGKGLAFQKQGKLIEVVASQTLGPKRSIAIVKVLDQYMVVGMSGDGMSLLANLGHSVDLDRITEEAIIGTSFTDTLQGAIGGGGLKSSDANKSEIGFRASLKKRLEGFKPL